MDAFAITNYGLEKKAALEIKELLNVKTKIEDSVVLFEAEEKDLAYLCYRGQSLIKVCSLLEKFEVKEVSDLKKIKVDFTKIIPSNKSFRIKCARQGSVDLLAQEVEIEVAEILGLQFKESPKVSLKDPDYIVYVYIFNETAYLGIDYVGFDLGKRDYRVFANPKSLHSNISYCLLRLAEFSDKKTLVDPFCLSGEVGIEAALFLTHKSPYYFSKNKFAFNKFMKFDFDKVDKEIKEAKGKIVLSSPQMSDVRAAQKNAKIAGVEKSIEFTRQDVEWLDFRLEKESVDCIVSQIPCPSNNMSERALKRVYDDIYFQIKALLNEKGKAVFLGKSLGYFKDCAKDVKVVEEISFLNGKDDLEIVVFQKA